MFIPVNLHSSNLNAEIGELNDAISGIVEELDNLLVDVDVEEGAKDLVKGTDHMLDTLRDNLQVFERNTQKMVDALNNQQKRSLTRREQDDVNEATKQLFQNMANAVGAVEKKVGDVPLLGQTLQEVLTTLNPTLNSVLNLIQDIAGPLADDVLEVAKKVLGGLDELLNNLVSGALDAVGGILDGALSGLLGGLLGGTL